MTAGPSVGNAPAPAGPPRAGRAADRIALQSAAACSVEIFVHQFLLLAVWLPLCTLVVPFLLFLTSISLIDGALASAARRGLPGDAGEAPTYLSDEQTSIAAAVLTLIVAFHAAQVYRRSRRDFAAAAAGSRRYLALKGRSGDALRVQVGSLWSLAAPSAMPPPDVCWFPNAAVLACALRRAQRPTIAISAGLWTSLESGRPLAEIILQHELAHLRYHDPARFGMLSALAAAASRVLRILLWAVALLVAFFLLIAAPFLAEPRGGPHALLRQEIMIGGVGLLVASLCPLAAAIVRRYIGLITSLVELRADVQAAAWTGGLGQFSRILLENPLVHRSTWSDRSRSFFSLRLTHLSESERVEILGNPEMLLTPKIRYLIFSLLLVLLLPLNGLTSQQFGGLFDVTAALVISLALTAAVTTMIMMAAAVGVPISPRRLLALSSCAVLFTALCHLNLFTFTYTMIALLVEFGLRTATQDPVLGAFASSFHDIGRQALDQWAGGWLLCGLLLAAAAVGGLAAAARKLSALRPVGSFWLAAVAVAAGAGTLIDGYDRRRAFELDGTALGKVASSWGKLTADLPGLRFTLAPCLALTAALLLLLLQLLLHVGAAAGSRCDRR